MAKHYSQMTIEEKRKVRALLDNINEHRKKQLDYFEKAFCNRIKSLINMSEEVRKGQKSIDFYLKENQRWNDWFNQFAVLIDKEKTKKVKISKTKK
jgi:hypothetical protein